MVEKLSFHSENPSGKGPVFERIDTRFLRRFLQKDPRIDSVLNRLQRFSIAPDSSKTLIPDAINMTLMTAISLFCLTLFESGSALFQPQRRLIAQA